MPWDEHASLDDLETVTGPDGGPGEEDNSRPREGTLPRGAFALYDAYEEAEHW